MACLFTEFGIFNKYKE